MRRLTVTAVLGLTLVAGCGSSSGSPAGTSGGPAAANPAAYAALIKSAGSKTASAGSSKLALESATSTGGQNVKFDGTGEFDYGAKTGRFEITTGTGAQAQKITELITGGFLYLQAGNDLKSYYKLKLSDLVGTTLAQGADPTSSFNTLNGVTDSVTKVGEEKVRGDHTTHYKGTIDVQKSLASAGAAEKAIIQKSFVDNGVTSLPFEAYLDDQGRIRKFVEDVNLTVKGTMAHSVTTLELYDFGSKVTVAAPPAAIVKDGAPLIAALKGQTAG